MNLALSPAQHLGPGMSIVTRHLDARDNPGVTFSFERASLTVTILRDELPPRITWVWAQGGHALSGSGVAWLNGRLTTHGRGARAFHSVVHERAHLSFGAIEAELRAMTGYQEPPHL